MKLTTFLRIIRARQRLRYWRNQLPSPFRDERIAAELAIIRRLQTKIAEAA